MDSLQPRASIAYRPDIDGLRAIAVIAVIIYHLKQEILPSGYLGVDIFFVISGFVVTLSILKKSRLGPRNLLISFYYQRVRRILPALLVCVLITTAISFSVVSNFGESLWTAICSLLGTSNIYLFLNQTKYGALDSDMNLFTQTWSLGVEEQFYLFAPLLFAVISLRRISIRRLTSIASAVLAILTAVSALIFISLYQTNPNAAFYLPSSRFWELSVGCLLALYVNLKPKSTMPSALKIIVSNSNHNSYIYSFFALTLLALLIPSLSISGITIPLNFLAVIGTAGCIYSFNNNSVVSKVLCGKTTVFIGQISFSLYLWHWPIIALFRWTFGVTSYTIPIIIVIIAIFSLASYYLVEQPLRFTLFKMEKWKIILFGACAATFTAGLLGLLGTYNHTISDVTFIGDKRFIIGGKLNDRQIEIPECESAKRQSSDFCIENASSQQRLSDGLFGNIDLGGPRILFVGDSHVKQLIYPVTQATSRNHKLLLQPYNPVSRTKEQDLLPIRAVVKQNDLVVFAISPDYIMSPEGPAKIDPDRLANLKDFLEKVAEIIVNNQGYLLLIKPTPRICSKYKFATEAIFRGTCEVDRAFAVTRLEHISLLYDSAAQRSKRILSIDIYSDFCPSSNKKCGLEDESGRLLYSDYGSHITKYGQTRVLSNLTKAIAPLVQ